MKVLLEKGVWLAEGEGDPCRTLVEDYAAEYETIEAANKALQEARKYRPLKKAVIIEDFI